MKYRILCEVSGGVTGHRSGYLKNEGCQVVFDDLDDAQAEADRLDRTMNGNKFRQADFTYTVEPCASSH